MATPPKKPKETIINYFTKLPSKTSIIEENPRKLAPIFNKQHVEEFKSRLEKFDAELLSSETVQVDYISSVKSGGHKPFRVEKKYKGPLRARLLQFSEDVRPPYFGTWQKQSALVTGRRPLSLDNEVFDYENDSEAEWDVGGPGESLKGDDSEDDEELDDYEIDMKTFVPHGYVSDDEVNTDTEENPANLSIDDNCDVADDDSDSIKIIADLRIRPQNPMAKVASDTRIRPQQVDQIQNNPPKQTPKVDIKPIILGLSFDNSPSISETKLQFLRAFQGVSCS